MAISAQVLGQNIQLSEITIVDRAQLPLISSATPYAGIQYQNLVARTSVKKMVAARIYTDADPKNRILTEATGIADLSSMSLSKPLDDQATLADLTAFSLSRGFDESLSTSETFVFSVHFERSFFDYVALDDISSVDKYFDANKNNVAMLSDSTAFGMSTVYSDSALVQEAHEFSVNKSLTESVGVSDVLTLLISNTTTPMFNVVNFNASTFG